MALTIHDIARMADVSTTAVSFVLNNRPGVSDATRKKVQDIIEQTGFIPNVHTRRLNMGKSFTIHVVLWTHRDSLYDQFAQETFQGIFNASKALGYSVVFTFAHRQMDCADILTSVRRKECDGVILYQVPDPTFISMLQQDQIPFVCVDSHIDRSGGLPIVEVDYYDAAYQATAHLCENGHRQIGFICPNLATEYYMSTFGGYTAALKARGLLCDPAWLIQVPFDEAQAEKIICNMLDKGPIPTAFFCAGDVFAIAAMRAIKAHGLRIPKDVSLIGLDDLVISRYLDPPLSSMAFNKIELGRVAVETLYAIMHKEKYDKINLLPTWPVSRDSVKNIQEATT